MVEVIIQPINFAILVVIFYLMATKNDGDFSVLMEKIGLMKFQNPNIVLELKIDFKKVNLVEPERKNPP